MFVVPGVERYVSSKRSPRCARDDGLWGRRVVDNRDGSSVLFAERQDTPDKGEGDDGYRQCPGVSGVCTRAADW